MPLVAPAMRRAAMASLEWLYDIRGGIIVLAAISGGMVLAFGLYSPARALTIALAGISVYFATIMIDPLKGLVLWLVTQPLLDGCLNISLGAGIPDLSLTRLCMALITVLLLARTAIRHHRLQPVNRFDILAFAFMIGMAQAGFRGKRGVSSFQSVFDLYFVPVLVYFAVKNLVSNRRSMRLILYAVLLVALYSAVYAFYESITGNILLSPGTTHKFYFYESGLRVLRGIYGSNDGFGRVFVMAIPIIFYFYLKTSSPSQKLLFAMCLALVFGGLYLTYKRAAWIGMLMVVFVMQFFYPRFRRLFIALFVVVAVALVFNWDSITTSTVYTERINSQSSTIDKRTEGWKGGIAIWSTNPLVGVGLRRYYGRAVKAGYDKSLESEHLAILVSAGLVGFLPYVGLLLLMTYDGYRHYRGRVAGSLADPDLVAVLWGILTGYVITVSTAQINNLMINAILFAVAGAVVYARRKSVSTQPE